jgi:arabinose-5-phosphate isomerase
MSGRTAEVLQVVEAIGARGIPVVAMTARADSPLAKSARLALILGEMDEACPLGLAPSSSTTAMLALGDALAFVVSQQRGFGREDFARFHPGGSLGRQLARAEQVMRPASQCRIAHQQETVRQLLIRLGRPGRRTGAVMVVDPAGRLAGIFTDSDLARLLECRADDRLDQPVSAVMTRQPATVDMDSRVAVALERLRVRKISELPVVDSDGRPVGLIDITDLLDYVSAEAVHAAEKVPHGLPVEPAEPDILPFPTYRDEK